MRTNLILTIALALTSACRQPGDTYYVTNEGDVYEGDEITNVYETTDDDSDTDVDSDTGTDSDSETDTDTSTDSETDTDSATDLDSDTDTVPSEPSTLRVDFDPGLAGYGDYPIHRWEDAPFGALKLTATGTVSVQEITVQGYVNRTPGTIPSTYWPTGQDTTWFAEHFNQCVLTNVMTGAILMGPTDPNEDGQIVFTEDFGLMDEVIIPTITCHQTGLWPEGEMDGFSVDILWPENIVAVDGNGDPIVVDLGNHNGHTAPSTRVVLYADDGCDIATTSEGNWFDVHNVPQVTQSSAMAGGSSYPGINEVALFNVVQKHTECADLNITAVYFTLNATDNNNTNWYAAVPVEIQDTTTGDLLWSGTLPANEPVGVAISVMELQAGDTHTVRITADTYGVSTARDDQVMLTLDSVEYSDGTGTYLHTENLYMPALFF